MRIRQYCVSSSGGNGGGGDGEGLYLKHGNDIYREKMLLQSPWIREELPNLKILL